MGVSNIEPQGRTSRGDLVAERWLKSNISQAKDTRRVHRLIGLQRDVPEWFPKLFSFVHI